MGNDISSLVDEKGVRILPSEVSRRCFQCVHSDNVEQLVSLCQLVIKDGTESYIKALTMRSATGGGTPLHLAAQLSRLKCLEVLADKEYVGDNQNVLTAVTSVDDAGMTPLHWAALIGDPKCCVILINAKSDLSATELHNRWTPLHLACRSGAVLACRVLIKAGADIDAKDACECQPIHYACEIGCLNAVNVLINSGCELTSPSKRLKTPLHVAAGSGNSAVIGRLLASQAIDDLNSVDRTMSTPLHLASASGVTESCRILIEAGADPLAEDLTRRTPYMCVAEGCSVELLNSLRKSAISKNVVETLWRPKEVQDTAVVSSAISKFKRRVGSGSSPMALVGAEKVIT